MLFLGKPVKFNHMTVFLGDGHIFIDGRKSIMLHSSFVQANCKSVHVINSGYFLLLSRHLSTTKSDLVRSSAGCQYIFTIPLFLIRA